MCLAPREIWTKLNSSLFSVNLKDKFSNVDNFYASVQRRLYTNFSVEKVKWTIPSLINARVCYKKFGRWKRHKAILRFSYFLDLDTGCSRRIFFYNWIWRLWRKSITTVTGERLSFGVSERIKSGSKSFDRDFCATCSALKIHTKNERCVRLANIFLRVHTVKYIFRVHRCFQRFSHFRNIASLVSTLDYLYQWIYFADKGVASTVA